MKKALSLILALVLCLSLYACASQAPTKTPDELMSEKLIGSVFKTEIFPDTFYWDITTGEYVCNQQKFLRIDNGTVRVQNVYYSRTTGEEMSKLFDEKIYTWRIEGNRFIIETSWNDDIYIIDNEDRILSPGGEFVFERVSSPNE